MEIEKLRRFRDEFRGRKQTTIRMRVREMHRLENFKNLLNFHFWKLEYFLEHLNRIYTSIFGALN